MPQTSHKTGVLLVVLSAIVFSSAGIFTKSIPADPWTIIFWRGVASISFTLVYLIFKGQLAYEIRSFNKPAWAVTLMFAAGSIAFISAFKLSTVTNVAMIYAASPFIAAALAWLFLKEAPSRTVLIASTLAMGGVAIILGGSFGALHLRGDLFALFMTLMMAGSMVVYRRFPATTAALPTVVSALILLPLMLYLGDPLLVDPSLLPALVLFGLVFAVASVTLSEGARRLPAPDTALLSTLEMPLAPFLAWMILAEQPPAQSLLGGVLILAAVVWSQKRVL